MSTTAELLHKQQDQALQDQALAHSQQVDADNKAKEAVQHAADQARNDELEKKNQELIKQNAEKAQQNDPNNTPSTTTSTVTSPPSITPLTPSTSSTAIPPVAASTPIVQSAPPVENSVTAAANPIVGNEPITNPPTNTNTTIPMNDTSNLPNNNNPSGNTFIDTSVPDVNNESSLPAGAIAGLVIGAVFFLLLVGFFVFKKTRSMKKRSAFSDSKIDSYRSSKAFDECIASYYLFDQSDPKSNKSSFQQSYYIEEGQTLSEYSPNSYIQSNSSSAVNFNEEPYSIYSDLDLENCPSQGSILIGFQSTLDRDDITVVDSECPTVIMTAVDPDTLPRK
eukprot:NODE_66_length_25735_cov_0.318497.p11 type:complete len:337 gc:universal NODE_66_length_25735_cov_0.318497:19522-20532(+)